MGQAARGLRGCRLRGIAPAAILAAAAVVAAAGASPPAPGAGEAAAAPEPLMVPDRIRADTVVVLAHPDDEGVVAPAVARWALDEHERIVHLYLTSGEFGSNRIGSVRGPAFGYLRLTELHWTLDRLGVAMFHSLGRSDRGGSEGPGAVLAAWDRERTVRELTRHLRLMRPRRLLAWFPGPAASHDDHMAAGAAALLACRAAADPGAFPEQMQTEGLRPWTIPEVRLFAQAEKVAYDRYPADPARGRSPDPLVLEIPVDVYSPALGRRYTDLAREAMKEQRAVAAAANLGRRGAFDEPLRLYPAFAGEEPPGRGPAVRLRGSPAQIFLEEIAAAVASPGLPRFFPPEAARSTGGAVEVTATVLAGPGGAFRGAAGIVLPEGWKASPASRSLDLKSGGSASISWSVEPPRAPGPGFAPGEIVLKEGRKRGEEIRVPFAIRLTVSP